jgi:hypothetical protein
MKRKCPVINQEKIQYYIGTVSDVAYSLSDIRTAKGLDWLNLSYNDLLEKRKQEKRENLAARTRQSRI